MQYQNNRHPAKTKRLALSAMFAALALIFSYIEAILPFTMGVPGIKLGIANLVIIIALYRMDVKYAFSINVVRILVAGLLFNGMFGALYSLSGAMLSLLVMYLLKKTKLFSMIGVSMAGGVAHNLGQLIIAAFIIQNVKMLYYFPILMISGIISGILIGIVAHVINSNVPEQLFR